MATTTTYNYTGGSQLSDGDVAWSNPTYAWDGNDSNRATATIDKERTHSLVVDTVSVGSLSGVIVTKVEIGFKYYSSGSNQVDFIYRAGTSSDYDKYGGDTVSSISETTEWFDITSGETSWDQTKLNSVEVTLYADTNSSTQSPLVNQFYLRVTTDTPPTISLNTSSIEASATEGDVDSSIQTFTIENSVAGSTLNWTASISGGSPWITLDPESGSTTTETDTVSATFYPDRTTFSAETSATYNCDNANETGGGYAWTNPSYAVDSNDSNRAYVYLSNGQFSRYLYADYNAVPFTDIGNITKVETGVKAYNSTDLGSTNSYVDAVFNGTKSDGGTYWGSVTSETTIWFDCTDDVNGPGEGNWTWNDIQTLFAEVQVNNVTGGAITSYVNQLYIRVTYQPYGSEPGTYYEKIIVSDTNATNDPQYIDVTFTVNASGGETGGPGSPIAKQLHYRKGGVTYDISLYSTTTDMVEYLQLRVDGSTVYAAMDTTGNSNATDLRVRKGGTTYAVLSSWAAS